MQKSPPRLRVLYMDGPGNVAGTYRLWKQGKTEPAEVNVAFSAEFFDLCRRLPIDALVVASYPDKAHIKDEFIEIIHRPFAFPGQGGIRFYISQACFSLWLIYQTIRFRPDMLLAQHMGLPWMMAPLKWCGVKIVPIMHNTLWPRGFKPPSRKWGFKGALLPWFWRRVAAMGLAVSPECVRQVGEITAGQHCPMVVAHIQYHGAAFRAIPPPRHDVAPFRVMFAARMEWEKGIREVLEAARRLAEAQPGVFAWDICGDGAALPELRQKLVELSLEGQVVLHGHLDRTQMLQRYEQAAVVLVPTGRNFSEGINRVAIEAVLAHRPLIVTSVCPAAEYFQACALEIPPNDADALAAAISRLKNDPALYERLVRGASDAEQPFYDRSQGWAASIEKICVALFGAPGHAAPGDSPCDRRPQQA